MSLLQRGRDDRIPTQNRRYGVTKGLRAAFRGRARVNARGWFSAKGIDRAILRGPFHPQPRPLTRARPVKSPVREYPMGIVLGTLLLTGGFVGFRYLSVPACPRCKSKKWDKKLCRPLLLCRRCSTRVDAHGRVLN
jgi:hypothetical protein